MSQTPELMSPREGSTERPAVNDCSDAVSLHASVGCPSPTPSSSTPPPKSASQVAKVLPRVFCTICRKNHLLRHCHRFQRMSKEHRLRQVVKAGNCVRCLAHDHSSSQCRSVMRCNVCQRSDHNTLLHLDESPSDSRTKRRSDRDSGALSHSARQSLQVSVTTRVRSIVLLPTCVCFLYFQGRRFRVRALLDPLSENSKISLAGLHSLGIPNLGTAVHHFVDVVVSSVYRPETRITVMAQLVPELTGTTPAHPIAATVEEAFFHFKLADEAFGKPGPVQMTFGGDVYPNFMRPRILTLSGLPTAQDSAFGWVVSGPCPL